MKLSIADFIRRLEGGEGPDEIVHAAARTGDDDGVLRRCAVPRRFDRRLFDEVLRGRRGTGGLTRDRAYRRFDDVRIAFQVEPFPGASGWYRVASARRTELLAEWRPDDPRFRSLHRRLAKHFVRRNVPLEAIYHLTVADPAAAERSFARRFRDADRASDIALCHDLVRALSEQGTYLDDRLRALVDREARLVEARTLWADEHYRTVRYFDRRSLARMFDELLDVSRPSAPWILHLHAGGGMGKTMFLRWAISRRCVPERVPVARIDFDDVEPAEARQPWRLLLRVLRQLRPQLPPNALDSVLEKLEEHGRALDHQGRALMSGRPAAEANVESPELRLEREAPEEAGRALDEVQGAGPVLVVFDTLEEAVLRLHADLPRLLHLFVRLRDACPRLRMILSGRYDLTEDRGVADLLGAAMRAEPVRPFDGKESREYLRHRGLRERRTIALAADRGGGFPFKLALLADLLHGGGAPGGTRDAKLVAADVLRHNDIDLLYLIARIVNRVEDPVVRWLLRYGVVPRKLTFEFVRDLILPYLADASAGRAPLDDASEDVSTLPGPLRDAFPPDARAAAAAAAAKGPAVREEEARRLWETLRRYASASSWVSVVPDDPGALRFHVEVLDPMRKLLSEKAVGRALHARAADYFASRAATAKGDGPRWAAGVREVIYHRTRVGDPDVDDLFRRHVREAADRGHSQHVDVAAELTGPDYVDHRGAPLRRPDGTPYVGSRTLAFAFYESAIARAAAARAGEPVQWAEVARDLAVLEAIERGLDVPVAPPSGVAWARAMLELHGNNPARARSIIESALQRQPDDARLQELLGDVLTRLKVKGGGSAYARATGAGERVPRLEMRRGLSPRSATGTGSRTVQLHLKAASNAIQFDRPEEAMDLCGRALGDRLTARASRPPPSAGAPAIEQARLDAMALALAARRPALALAWSDPRPADRGRRAHSLLLEARASLQLHWAADAVRLADEASDLAGRLRIHEVAAGATEVRGEAKALGMDFPAAFRCIEDAIAQWRALGSADACARCFVLLARSHLDGIGHVYNARKAVDEGLSLRLRPDDDARISLQAIRLRVLRRAGVERQFRAEADALLAAVRDMPARHRATARAQVLSLVGEPAGYLDDLLSALAEIDSPHARAAALASLRDCPPLGPRARGLCELLPPPPPEPSETKAMRAEAILYRLRAAEAYRVASDVATALAMLSQAVELTMADGRAGPTVLHRARAAARCAARAGLPAWATADGAPAFQKAPPLMRASDALDHAQFRLDHGYPGGPALLEQARAPLAESPLTETCWHAQAIAIGGLISRAEGRADLASAQLSEAAEIYDRLGDVEASLRRREAAPAGTPDGGVDVNLVGVEPVVIEERDRALVIAVRERGGLDELIRAPIDGVPMLAELFAEREQVNVHALARWVHGGPEQVRQGMGSSLSAPLAYLLRNARATGRRNVRMEVAHPLLHAVPWEILLRAAADEGPNVPPPPLAYRAGTAAHARRHRTRWLQHGLNLALRANEPLDGHVGRPLRDALRQLQQPEGLMPPDEVHPNTFELIDRRVTARSLPTPSACVLAVPGGRGSRSVGLDAARAYAGQGIAVHTIESDRADEILELLLSSRPALLHVCCQFVESYSLGGVRMRLSPAEGSSRETLYSCTSFGQLLQGLPPTMPAPVICLDVPRQGGRSENARQLCLRNSFAGDLFGLGEAPAILAGGLPSEFVERLAEGIRRGSSLHDVCADWWRRYPSVESGDERWLDRWGLSLFAHDPDRRVALELTRDASAGGPPSGERHR